MLFFSLPASAHGFGRLYNLPVPFWLYAWGAGTALVVSFLLAGYFATAPVTRGEPSTVGAPRSAWVGFKALSVFLLLLTIATALFGNRDPYRNFSMTFFWVVFVLGFTYVTAFAGNLWDAINPWRVITSRIADVRFRYPERCGDWPALALYLGFIWFELFNHGRPSTLGWMLLAYTGLNFLGVWLVGASTWFRHCEFFSVFLRLVATIPRLTRERPERLSTVVFALAMLSTTAFDGLRATQVWVSLFWNDPTGIVTSLAGNRPVLVYGQLRPWYIGWETLWLLASPFIYFGVYWIAIALAKLLSRSTRSVRDLMLDFGYTLLPIALVYNVTHYSTLILSQGMKIVSLVSDPFGWGWNLFGTATMLRAPILPPMGMVWHTQVVLILLGHIASLYVAHVIALRVLPTRRQAMLSQLPMLALMVLFTVAGLWILALPLTAALMR